MRTLWRISNHCDLEGLGGERANGRWHTAVKGKRIVYLSDNPALALIEILANLKGNPRVFPKSYRLMKISVDDSVSIDALIPGMLESNWRANESVTQTIGDAWLASGRSALLAVPSAPASDDSTNYLFNPHHSDANGLTIEWCKWVDYDQRLFHMYP